MSYSVITSDFHTAISYKYPNIDILTVIPITDNRSIVTTDIGQFDCVSTESQDGVIRMYVYPPDLTIKDFVKQCTVESGNVQQFDKERFTELIVDECAKWVNDHVGFMSPEARLDLRNHFGIDK